MPRVSVIATYNSSFRDITILSNYITDSAPLEARYQYLISEVVMLRLFSILETTISEVAFKLACSAPYRNGTLPNVHLQCRSVQDAVANMLSQNRVRPLLYLKWTKATYIKDSIEHVLNITDHFYVNIQNHSAIINEMRIVRNHIAHRTTSTARDYTTTLRNLYGGNPKLTVGAFLTSTNRNPVSNISRYIATSRIIINDITSG